MTLLAGIGPLGVPELLIIAFIIVLVFGVGRLPEVGGAVGKGIREFRKASSNDDDGPGASSDTSASLPASASADSMEPPVAPASEHGVFCSECGARNARDAKFCAECGKPIATAVG